MGFFRKKLTPSMEKEYRKVYADEMAKQKQAQREARLREVREKARRDAQRVSRGRAGTLLGAMASAGKDMHDKLQKLDTDKFDTFVTGERKRKR